MSGQVVAPSWPTPGPHGWPVACGQHLRSYVKGSRWRHVTRGWSIVPWCIVIRHDVHTPVYNVTRIINVLNAYGMCQHLVAEKRKTVHGKPETTSSATQLSICSRHLDRPFSFAVNTCEWKCKITNNMVYYFHFTLQYHARFFHFPAWNLWLPLE